MNSRWTRRLVRPIDAAALGDLAWRRRFDLVLAAGVVLRLATYAWGRSLWMDEGSLAGNILGHSPLRLFEPLSNVQAAPPGYLFAERVLSALSGGSRWILRLPSLAAGLAALWLVARPARRHLTQTPALLTLWLCAFSDDLVYYASELKPYSTDVAITLLCLNAALDFEPPEPPRRPRRWAGLLALGVVAPWFSPASIFILGATIVVWLVGNLRARRRRATAAVAGLGLIWLASAATSRAAMLTQLTGGGMWTFWDFAFPPRILSTREDLAKLVRIMLDVFVNPLNLVWPVLPWPTVLVAAAVFATGVWRLARENGRLCALAILPVFFAFAAAWLRVYPFHGRLILFLFPLFAVVIAQALFYIYDRLRCRFDRRAGWLAVALLLSYPTLDAIWNACGERVRTFTTHGELREIRFWCDPTSR